MTDKICHLCETHYNDDPFFREQPAHTSEQCLGILQFKMNQAEFEYKEIERQFIRAKLAYIKGGKS